MSKILNYEMFVENILLSKEKEFSDRQEKERQERNKDKVTKGTVGFVSSGKTKPSSKHIDDYGSEGEMEETQGQGEMEFQDESED